MKRLLVATGPSGIGKTYLAQQLVARYPASFEEVKLYTTRAPRANEDRADRVFVSRQTFQDMTDADQFGIVGTFHGNRYGYEKSSLMPAARHLIVNAWPAFVPKFKGMPGVCIVGLTTPLSNLSLLERRMLERGDSPEKVSERLEIIRRDLTDYEKILPILESCGKSFMITGDDTIPAAVIPWIEQCFELSQPK